MKIIIIAQEVSIDQPGGSGRVVWEQALSLQKRGHTVAIGVPLSARTLAKKEQRDGVTVFRYGNVKRRGMITRSAADVLDTAVFVRELLSSAKWDVLIAHHPHVAYGALRVPAARSMPFLYVFHASAAAEIRYEGLSRPSVAPPLARFAKPFFVQWAAWVERKVLKRAHAVGVFSNFSATLVKQLYGRAVKNKPVKRLPMGVNTKRFKMARGTTTVRKRLQLDPKAFIFVTVRRLVPRTGVKLLIDAFRIVHDRLGDGAELYVVGEGRQKKMLTAHARAIGLKRSVHFVGRVDDDELPLWYQTADVCVLPTVAYEGFGVSTIEALASGVPVIGTPVGAIPEILLSFDERFLADAAKPLALADRMVWFAEEGAKDHWHDKTRDFVKRFYSWDKHGKQVEELIETLKKANK